MNQGDYLKKGEAKLSEADVSHRSDWTENEKGDLICTENRMVFLNDSKITDISIPSIDAIEYSPPSYDMSYVYVGGSLIAIGIIMFTGGFLPEEFQFIGGVLMLIGGLITSLILLNKESELMIHTAKKSFKFASDSDNLLSITKQIRTK